MKRVKKHTLIVILLWLFAPAAWIVMWKDKRYHSWFPTLLYMNGVIFGFVFLTQGIVVLPRLQIWYDQMNVHTVPNFTPSIAIALIGFCIFQIFLGVYLKSKIRTHGHLLDHLIALVLAIFTIDFIFGFITGLLAVILPV